MTDIHYNAGMELLGELIKNKDDPDFGVAEASLLVESAKAYALLGILKEMTRAKWA